MISPHPLDKRIGTNLLSSLVISIFLWQQLWVELGFICVDHALLMSMCLRGKKAFMDDTITTSKFGLKF